MAASLMKARLFAASLSYRVATRRHCLILLKKRSTKLRARYRYGLKQIGSLRFRLGWNIRPCSLLAGGCRHREQESERKHRGVHRPKKAKARKYDRQPKDQYDEKWRRNRTPTLG